jgi:putative transposase
MLNATKIRLYPTTAQREALTRQFGCARWVFNWGLELSRRTYLETGKGLTYFNLNKQLPELKREHEWLREADSQALQVALQNLAAAYEAFFKGRSRYPRFRSKHSQQSFAYPQRVRILERRSNGWGLIGLPKVGPVRANIHREVAGRIKTVTISLDAAGRYWASILTDDGAPLPAVSMEGPALGIDVGLTHFAVTSTGRKVANRRFVRRAAANLRRKQKTLSRKQKGSKSRQKSRIQVARAHEKVSRARADFLHKLSRQLVNENQVIAVEDLNVKGMMRNRSLAKAIGDCSWSMFTSMLAYKAEREGKAFVKCHRFFPSSKVCNDCGHVENALPLSVRNWTCRVCGSERDRDINAARNIRDEGLRILAEGHPATAGGGRLRRKPLAVDASPREARSLVLRTGNVTSGRTASDTRRPT